MKNNPVLYGDKICLDLIRPIYKQVKVKTVTDDNVVCEIKNKLIKEKKICKCLNKDAIVSVEQYITSKGVPAINRSIIFDKYTNQHYATWHKQKDIMNLLTDKKPVETIGFGNSRGYDVLMSNAKEVFKPKREFLKIIE